MTGPLGAGPSLRPYLSVVLAMPLLASTLGIDGGAVFQIVAVEELGLSARAVGIAFGLGVLSVPLQLYAARMPLWRARDNLRIFLAFGAVGCLLLAVIVATADDGSPLAATALGLTVCAEIALSVLYATSWQPLLSYGLPAPDRQHVNSCGRAAGGAVLAVALIPFGLLPTGGRVVSIGLVAGCAVLVLMAVGKLAAPERRLPPVTGGNPDHRRRPGLPGGVLPIYLALAVAGFATWPLFLIYTREVLWPAANLGLVGALQMAGSLGAAFTWRPSTRAIVVRRSYLAAVALALSSTSMLLVAAPVDTLFDAVVVLLLLGSSAVSGTIILLALMELAHDKVSEETSVRTLTFYDVIASTSFQIGLVASGFLIDASVGASRVDPYRVLLSVAAVGLLCLVRRLRVDQPE